MTDVFTVNNHSQTNFCSGPSSLVQNWTSRLSHLCTHHLLKLRWKIGPAAKSPCGSELRHLQTQIAFFCLGWRGSQQPSQKRMYIDFYFCQYITAPFSCNVLKVLPCVQSLASLPQGASFTSSDTHWYIHDMNSSFQNRFTSETHNGFCQLPETGFWVWILVCQGFFRVWSLHGLPITELPPTDE